MSYRIVYPVAMPIDASTFGDAVKKFVKLNHYMNIEQLILTDQYKHMKANVRYYDVDRHRKASIQLYPMDATAVASIPSMVGFSSSDPKAPYPAGYAVGPSSLGGPAGIIGPAGPLMVERPAVIGMSGVSGVLYGAKTTATPAMTFGPTAVLTPSKQIIPIAPVNPIGTDGRPVEGVPVPFGHGVVASSPAVVVGGPMMVGSPVRFGRGVY